MHLPDLVSDLAVILLTGGVITVIFKKLNLPLVLGYILAGFLIGPYMPLFFSLADIEAVSTWSEIGIIILMFCLGLEFNLHKLASVGGTAIITALVEVGGMLAMGFAVGQLMGWGTMDSIFLGGMLSMSSTTIIIKAFDELNVRKTDFAQLVFGASAPRSMFAAAAPDSTRTPTDTLQWPLLVARTITSQFGHRVDPITGEISSHTSTDIACAEGTLILAAADGIVTVDNVLDS